MNENSSTFLTKIIHMYDIWHVFNEINQKVKILDKKKVSSIDKTYKYTFTPQIY